ncbi:MAG: hypothetical protein FWC24_05380 [Treponema sp.]|nr:hypothetical protein [Treponema sp.]
MLKKASVNITSDSLSNNEPGRAGDPGNGAEIGPPMVDITINAGTSGRVLTHDLAQAGTSFYEAAFEAANITLSGLYGIMGQV